jgi:hypothetical protein
LIPINFDRRMDVMRSPFDLNLGAISYVTGPTPMDLQFWAQTGVGRKLGEVRLHDVAAPEVERVSRAAVSVTKARKSGGKLILICSTVLAVRALRWTGINLLPPFRTERIVYQRTRNGARQAP